MKLSTSTRKKFRITNKLKKVSKPGRFRLSIFRSSKNISAQIIDDSKNITLLSASSVEKDIKETKTKKYAMLIYNKDLSVCPLTTHIPIKKIPRLVTKKNIFDAVRHILYSD